MMWLSLLTNGMSFSRSFLLIRLAFSKISFLFLSRFSTIEILFEEAAAIEGIIDVVKIKPEAKDLIKLIIISSPTI